MDERILDLLFGAAQSLLVTLITALVAFFFTKKYYSRVAFATKLKKYGFNSVRTSKPTDRELRRLFNESDRIRIMYVSGAGFLRGNIGVIERAMQKGKKVEIIVSERETRFLTDIERLEKRARLRDKDTYISDEIEIITGLINELKRDNPEFADNVTIRHFGTEYRLPFIAGDYTYFRKGHKYRRSKVWLYITLPPYKSFKSAILELLTDTKDEDFDESLDMVEMVQKHFEAIWEKESPSEYWEQKKLQAIENMCARAGRDRILIECAAQHPLVNGEEAGEEFKARLEATAELYKKLTSEGEKITVYVPGSIHISNGTPDRLSLSEVGKKYLLSLGIPAQNIFGDEKNIEYKGDDGVYNSADECFVASRIFFDGDFKELICVCSSYQTIRKTLFYMEFGVMPKCYGIPSVNMFHDAFDEACVSLNGVMYDDHSWQDKGGKFFRKSRNERKPK